MTTKLRHMNLTRFEERRKEFAQASARLNEACGLPADEIVRNAVIQRFEFTFELFWKTAQLYLEHQGFPGSGPRSTLKSAFLFGLIPNEKEADAWLRMLEDRNLTSPTYHRDIALAIHTRIVAEHAPLLAVAAQRFAALD